MHLYTQEASKPSIDQCPLRFLPLITPSFRLLDLPNELIIMVAENLTFFACSSDLKALIEITSYHSLLFISVLTKQLRETHDRSPILWAARNGYLALAQRLLANGADVEVRDGSNRTALHWAAMNGHIAVIKLLLDNGCDMNAYVPYGGYNFDEGYTAFHSAARCGQHGSVQLLLDYGFDVGTTTSAGGCTALHIASDRGCDSVVETLLQGGADVNTQCLCGSGPLIIATSRGNFQTMGLLLAAHADTDLRGPEGETALHHAAANKDVATVWLLLDGGADINATDREGLTALHWVFTRGQLSYVNHESATNVTEFLLEEGIGVNLQSLHGTTVLHLLAAELNLWPEHYIIYADVVNLVLAEGGNRYLADASGRVPDFERLYGYLGFGRRWAKRNGVSIGALESSV